MFYTWCAPHACLPTICVRNSMQLLQGCCALGPQRLPLPLLGDERWTSPDQSPALVIRQGGWIFCNWTAERILVEVLLQSERVLACCVRGLQWLPGYTIFHSAPAAGWVAPHTEGHSAFSHADRNRGCRCIRAACVCLTCCIAVQLPCHRHHGCDHAGIGMSLCRSTSYHRASCFR